MPVRILIIEDDPTFSKIICAFLSKKGFDMLTASTLTAGEKVLQQEKVDLLLLDYRLPDGIGLDLIAKMGNELPVLPTIVITSFDDVRTAVKSIRSGAFEYVLKPVNPDELYLSVQEAIQKRQPTGEATKRIKTTKQTLIRGNSTLAQRLYQHVNLVAPTEMSVMIIGESGTGKEHIARAIHEQSKRAGKPFVAVDCGVLSRELAASELFGHVKGAFTGALQDKTGLLEKANGGTLFLDEIGNLGYEVQVKLLRTLQERSIQAVGSDRLIPVDFRLITATNENLSDQIDDGKFREDIYHRINEFRIQMPALRERGSDLNLFIDHFIGLANTELDRHVARVSPEVLSIFQSYDWPGNLRELGNVIKRLVLLCQTEEAGLELIPEEMIAHTRRAPQHDLKLLQEETEKERIRSVLDQVRYNKTKAAKLLNIDRKTLYHKMERYGLNTD